MSIKINRLEEGHNSYPLVCQGVTKLLNNQNIHKATGPVSIPSFILKSAADQLAPILTDIFQTSIDTGEVPQDWRDANIVPLFKKNERHLASNYRPVSLTSITLRYWSI